MTSESAVSKPGDALPAVPDGVKPQAVSLVSKAHKTLQLVQSVVIDCQEVYDLVLEEVQAAAKDETALTNMRLELTRPIDASKEKIMAFFRPAITDCTEVVKQGRLKLNAYDAELARKKREAELAATREAERLRQIELDEIAERKRVADEAAAAEQKKLDDAAEATRQAQQRALEAQNLLDSTARAAAARALEEAEQNQRNAQASVATSEAIAREVTEEAQHVAMLPAIPAIPVADTGPVRLGGGTGRRKVWKFEVQDKRLLILAAAAQLVATRHPGLAQQLRALKAADLEPSVLAAWLEVEEKGVRAHVTHAKDQAVIPGVRVWDENDLSFKRS